MVAGITTNHCCETTARVGANLGHQVVPALGATHTFDRQTPDGTILNADRLAAVTAANLHGEVATVANIQQLLKVVPPPSPGAEQRRPRYRRSDGVHRWGVAAP